MDVGLLTAPFVRDKSLEEVIAWAGEKGFAAVEVASGVGSRHLDPLTFDERRADAVRQACERYGVRLSSLAWYVNLLEPDAGKRQEILVAMRKLIDAAVALGVEVVCIGAGRPMPGKSKMQTIEEEVPKVYPALAEYAGERGIKLAMENWYATNIQHLGHWDAFFTVVPHKNLGLNFDPSHLYWQGIDYLWAVEKFGPRIFHTHAKDTEVKEHRLRYLGNQEGGWWRYVIPGLGGIAWGPYIAALRSVGYNGVLSIEHEDSALGREEGFLIGLKYLSQFLA